MQDNQAITLKVKVILVDKLSTSSDGEYILCPVYNFFIHQGTGTEITSTVYCHNTRCHAKQPDPTLNVLVKHKDQKSILFN